MITHRFKVKTRVHATQWAKILGSEPIDEVVLSHQEYMCLRSAISAIRPPVVEVNPVGRPKGSVGKNNRRKSTVTLHDEDWDKLDEIGPSRGKAIEKLLKDNE